MSKIFSGDYSVDMWEAINEAKSKADLQNALYFVCCRLQEFESRFDKHTHKIKPAVIPPAVAIAFVFIVGFMVGAQFVLWKLSIP